jgi:autotransporter-associated beta strand protein
MKLLKNRTSLTFKTVALWLLTLVCCLLANNAKANLYLDVNGTTSGFGITNGGNFNWDDNNWTTDATGVSPTTPYPTGAGNFPRFTPDASANFTITLTNDEHMAGLFTTVSTATMTINSAGGGFLDIDSGDQGFLLSGTLIINAPIGGTGGLGPENNSSGTIKLFGTNTYSGGTPYGYSGAPLTYFNNNNSFGTGPIKINSGQPSGRVFGMLGTGGATITLTNAFTIGTANTGFNWAADPNTPVVLTGNWTLGANGVIIQSSGGSTSPLTVSGAISGTGGVTFTANNGSETIVSGANTYSGKTVLSQGANPSVVGVIVSVSSLNKVSGGVASSSLGHPTTVANGTINIGSTTFPAELIYTGPGETSDRVINLAGATGGAILEADGTGALVLTAVNTATGVGAKTLTLQGSNTGANSIGKIVDSSSGATAVVKTQAGAWHLTAANTYTGGTTVSAGTLYLDTTAALASSSALTISSGATVNLNFTGTNAINSLVINGVTEVSGVWGPPGSAAPNQNAVFAGTGYLNVQGKPVIVQQPVSGAAWQADPTSFAFTVGVAGDLGTLTYQWKQNGVNIPGATSSSYPIPSPVAQTSAGAYSCAVTNAFGNATSASATFTVWKTNDYTQTIRAAGPLAYWRLDETNGNVAFDSVSTNNGNYVNVNLNQHGFSALTNSDPGIGVPANAANSGVMIISNSPAAFAFGGFPFTLEAWAMSTNFGAGVKQRIISTLSVTGTGGYGFGFPDNSTLEFTSGGIADYDLHLGTPISAGVWHHFVAVFDGNSMNFYLDGASVGSIAIPVTIPNPANQLTVGNNPYTFFNGSGFISEQLFGGIDEVAIYNRDLSAAEVNAHYVARYSDAPVTVTPPVVTPPVNYVSLTTTLTESAGGGVGALTYQWYKGAGTGAPVGGNSPDLVLSPLQLSDAGSYHCVVSDTASHTADSGSASVTVLPIPASAAQLNLINGLVLHLPFDGDYNDISGRQNNGTAVGAPSFVGSGAVGGNSLHYGTTSGVATNYVTLGVRPDFQFGTTNDFTVAYWTRGNNSSLPFFCDSSAGLGGILTFAGGYYFGPSTNGNGSWEAGLSSSGSGQQATVVGSSMINDGNWHHVVHTVKRTGSLTTYVDGVSEPPYAVSFISGSIDTTNAANIGQDGTGKLVLADAQGDIDDLGVWKRVLTSLEVSGIYLAGATNHVSFAPVVIVPVALQVQQVSLGQYQIVWPGSGWTLQASPTVTGGYTNVPSATSPYPVPTSSGPQLFYRLTQ